MKNYKKEEKKPKTGKKFIIFILVVVLVILVFLFGTKIYLWASVFLGNDIIIKLVPDKDNVFLINDQSETITFESSIITSPFCSVFCSFNFTDLSENKIIEKDSFNIKTTQPISKSYDILAPSKGTGQKIFRFDINCKSEKTFLCNTQGELERKSSIVTLNYNLSSKNLKIKDNSKDRILILMQGLGQMNNDLGSLNETGSVLSNSVELSNFSEDLTKIKNKTYDLNYSLFSLKEHWENGDFDSLLILLNEKEQVFSDINNQFNHLNDSILSSLFRYNSLIDTLNETETKLRNYQKSNFTNESLIEFNKLINDFNNAVNNLNKKSGILEKENMVNSIKNKTETLSVLIEQSKNKNTSYSSSETINSLQSIKIIFSRKAFFLNISFKEPSPECCLFNECKDCCDESCYSERTKFPIIFLHGHAFSKQASAENNLNVFDKMQRALEKNKYLNGDTILLSSTKKDEKGILGKTFYPITLKASYYFDIMKTKDSTTILQTKKDNIDTYSIRLKDIISEVKYKTNREKVIIIAYSMGGLVARRYLQVFGEQDVERLILIATPNNGISDNVLQYCSFFGEEAECNDMNKDSLFINKLDTGENPQIPIFNIIGIGCDMNGEQGDGIVKNSSAYLGYAKNYFVKGKCETLNVFHSDIIFPDKYHEVYDLLVQFLKQTSISL